MTVKIMKGFGNGSLHELVSISSYESKTIYFSKQLLLHKTKAVLRGKDPISERQPFKVTNDDTGYSVMTLTFSIKESTIPQVLGGEANFKKNLTKTDFPDLSNDMLLWIIIWSILKKKSNEELLNILKFSELYQPIALLN